MLFSFVFNYTYVSNKETKCKPQIKIEPQYIQPRCSILLLGHFRVPKLLTFKRGLSPKPIRLFAREQKIIFHINSFALSVALKKRLGETVTRKWPIKQITGRCIAPPG